MKVLSTEFVTSAAAGGRVDDVPADGLAQIAFAGRSNVGKSTLLNALTRTKLARTSAAPGKTRLANIFRISLDGGHGGAGRWTVYFVDLPGYGYARGGADSAADLSSVAAAYFAGSRFAARGADDRDAVIGRQQPANSEQRTANHGGELANRATLHLIDARHPGLESDLQAARWFDSLGVARHVVATKIDKLSRSERTRNLKEIERMLDCAVLPVSAARGEGLDELWRLIARVAKDRHP